MLSCIYVLHVVCQTSPLHFHYNSQVKSALRQCDITCKVAADTQFAGDAAKSTSIRLVALALTMHACRVMPTPKSSSLYMYIYGCIPSILYSNSQAPVAQLVRHLTGIQKTQVEILAVTQWLFFASEQLCNKHMSSQEYICSLFILTSCISFKSKFYSLVLWSNCVIFQVFAPLQDAPSNLKVQYYSYTLTLGFNGVACQKL